MDSSRGRSSGTSPHAEIFYGRAHGLALALSMNLRGARTFAHFEALVSLLTSSDAQGSPIRRNLINRGIKRERQRCHQLESLRPSFFRRRSKL